MKYTALLFIFILLLGACATGKTAVTKEPDEAPLSQNIAVEHPPTAEELLTAAATALTQPDATAAGSDLKARGLLNRLIQTYPDSQWRNTAEALIMLMDLQAACEAKIKGDRQICERILSQKIKCEESENQCRQEATRLLQENEQLKKDLQNLKNLEIELEQRNRGLR